MIRSKSSKRVLGAAGGLVVLLVGIFLIAGLTGSDNRLFALLRSVFIGDVASSNGRTGDPSAGNEPAVDARKAAVNIDGTAENAPKNSTGNAAAPADQTPGSSNAETSSVAVNLDGAADPTLEIIRVEPDGDTLIAGRSDAGSIIGLLTNGKVLGKGIADENGEFVITLDEPLAIGSHMIEIGVKRGEETAEYDITGQQIIVMVPETDAQQAVVLLGGEDQPPMPVQLPDDTQLASNLAGQTAVAQGQSQDEIIISIPTDNQREIAVDAVEVEDNKIYVAGKSRPNSTVELFIDNETIGQTKSNDAGRWLIEKERKIAEEGQIELRVDQLSADEAQPDKIDARVVVQFTRTAGQVALIPNSMAIAGSGTLGAGSKIFPTGPANIIIRRGDNLWTIARRNYGHGIRYTAIYLANDDQIIDPDLIYPGQVFVMPTGDVNWPEDKTDDEDKTDEIALEQN